MATRRRPRAAVVGLIVLLSSFSYGSESFSQHIKDLWYTGHRDDVLEIAQQRLRSNPDDFAGLLLKMDYEVTFLALDDLPKTLDKIEGVGRKLSTPRVKELWPDLESFIVITRNTLTTEYTPQRIEQDRRKGVNNNAPLPFLYILRAAEDDGLIKRLDKAGIKQNLGHDP